MNFRTFFAFMLAIGFSIASVTHADVILQIEVDPPVDGGDTSLVSFLISGDSNEELSSFNFPVDVGPAGFGPGPFISFNVNPVANVLAGVQVAPNFAGPQNGFAGSDVILNLTTSSPLALTSTPIALFDLVLDVDPGAPTGSIPVSVDPTAAFYQFNVNDSNGNSIAVTGPSPGSVNIVAAIPEPSSLMIVLLTTAGLGLRRRRGV